MSQDNALGVVISGREMYDQMVKLAAEMNALRQDLHTVQGMSDRVGTLEGRVTALERWKGTLVTIGGGGGLAGAITAAVQLLGG